MRRYSHSLHPGGGGLCSCLVVFPVSLNSRKKDVLATFFFKTVPYFDHSHRLVSEGHLFTVTCKLF